MDKQSGHLVNGYWLPLVAVFAWFIGSLLNNASTPEERPCSERKYESPKYVTHEQMKQWITALEKLKETKK